MSRAFVKEPDGDESAGELQDLPLSPHANYVTPTGLAQLEARLAALEAERKALTVKSGDLASRPALARLAREIRYFEARIASAILVDLAGQPAGRAAFGAVVRVADEEDRRREFQIVGEDEAEPEHGKVSWVSPLARALQDAEVGDIVTWRRPSGDVELEILEVRRPEG
ncbi:MAG: GreA/GreB family elongation factor [Rhodospirillales bacterium]|nr:GreA/GreB family elongation factor [Rhodospirillales bacterium]MDH3791004.1 GreA/GreB family elongation factor [Rhodospirillales bacterium]MDH3909724.1 GreA/GreB family elongation factor [Rhodospirillales bacterium]MDH3916732.1 GreA/GreB family elongation factor [Rhodospirillales bacterium]MDH3966053.1 GreA/GreB family elongation factor [Rhodospirillales bacterium]